MPLLVFANKQDLLAAMEAKEIADSLKLHNVRDRQWAIHGCSAKTGDGLKNGITWVLSKLRSRA